LSERIDTLVVGAGVVGLAIARALALAGREVIVIEALDLVGSVTSARNSEVIHAGLYYPSGSAKARLCVEGKHALYRYAAEHQVPHKRCGKLIVAANADEEAKLLALQRQAGANGVGDVVLLTGAQARALEPELHCSAALHSPSTGIVDSHAFMLALQGDAEAHGAMVALKTPFERAAVRGDGGFDVQVGGEQPMTLQCRALINSAGLDAAAVARRIDGLAARHVPAARRCKGHYFALSGRAPFARLVYPLHNAAGLGVHYTIDLGGQGRFGPDTEWLPDDDAPIDYTVDASRRDAFAGAIARYWPAVRADALQPAYSGVRPKIVGPDAPAADFVIAGPEAHGVPGLVNLFGIESPGLTASLAIADAVAERLRMHA